jgi:hypothetical protein
MPVKDPFDYGRSYKYGGFKRWTVNKNGYIWKKDPDRQGSRQYFIDWRKPNQKFYNNHGGQLDSGGFETYTIPGARRRVKVSHKTAQSKMISKLVTEFIKGPKGERIQNPLWRTPVQQRQRRNGLNVEFVQTPWKTKALSTTPEQRKNRALLAGDYLQAKKLADDQYGATALGLAKRTTDANNQFQDGVQELAQNRLRNQGALNQKAARLGLGFQQGRLNGLQNLDTQYDANLKVKDNYKTALMGQIGAEDQAARTLQSGQTASALNNTVGRLLNEDRAADIGNPLGQKPHSWATPTAKYPHLDPTTGRAYSINRNGTKVFAR